MGNEPVKQLFPTPPVIATHGNACGQRVTYGNISGVEAPTGTQNNNMVFASKQGANKQLELDLAVFREYS